MTTKVVNKNKNNKSKNKKNIKSKKNVQNIKSTTTQKLLAGTSSKTQMIRNGPRSKTKIHESICALVNPFCIAAKGAKWPDGNGGDTLTYQVRGRHTLATNADGGFMTAYLGMLPYGQCSTSYTPPNYTFNSVLTDTATSSSFTSIFDSYRIVTWGVVIRSLLPALTAQGLIVVRTLTSPSILSDVIPANSTTGANFSIHPVYAGLEIPVVSRPMGNGARTFVGSYGNGTIHWNWEPIVIEMTGGPASSASVVSVEYFYNVEFTLKETNLSMHQMVKPDAPHAPKTMDAASIALNRIETTALQSVEKFGSHVLEKVESAAYDVLTGAMEFLGL